MKCNLCCSTNLQKAISVPNLPISKDYSGSDYRFNLNLYYCHACGLLQICDPINPIALYSAKSYLTGFHKPKHIHDLISCALHYKNPSNIIEIGCNDGSTLKEMSGYGFIGISGVEPNPYAAEKAENAGFIYHDYLTLDLAKTIVHDSGKFDFVLCRHVIEHVSDINSFFASINHLISDNGILITEFPDTELGFDSTSPTILFEEHVNHLTKQCLEEMFKKFGFSVLERRSYTFGGGSIAFVCRKIPECSFSPPTARSKIFPYYTDYEKRLVAAKAAVSSFIDSCVDMDIILYGAASRSAMFINVMGIADRIDYVFDDRKDLHGLIMPGTNKKISPYLETPKPKVGLLGIGSENEWKIEKYFHKTLSLFPPRFKI